MSSYLQTVEVSLPNTTRLFYTMEMRPVCPIPLEKGQPCRVTKEDGTVITWCHDGCVVVDLVDKTSKTFYPKPTLAEAVTYKNDGTFFKFNKDGSVEITAYKTNWFYGPSQERAAEEGEIETAHRCTGDNWDLYSICCGYCDYMKEQYDEDDYDRYRDDFDSGVDCDAYGSEGYGYDW